jgi:Nucleoside diphosphate kinase
MSMDAFEALAELSVLPDKRARYGEEVFFREVWRELLEGAGDGVSELLHTHAFVLFKPDGIVARAAKDALGRLELEGFTPVGAAVVYLDRLATRWLWLYRFNVASIERVWLHELINSAGPSLLVALRDERATVGESIPGSVRLTDHKGPSRPERRRPDQLRTVLGVNDRLLNYMHTSDEPADMVRELGILLTAPQRKGLLEQILEGEAWPSRLDELLVAAEAATPAHTLRPEDAIAGICERARTRAAAARSPAERARWAQLERAATAAAHGGGGARQALWELLRPHAEDIERWDLIALATWVIQHNEPGIAKQTLGDAPPPLWREGETLAGAPLIGESGGLI